MLSQPIIEATVCDVAVLDCTTLSDGHFIFLLTRQSKRNSSQTPIQQYKLHKVVFIAPLVLNCIIYYSCSSCCGFLFHLAELILYLLPNILQASKHFKKSYLRYTYQLPGRQHDMNKSYSLKMFNLALKSGMPQIQILKGPYNTEDSNRKEK